MNPPDVPEMFYDGQCLFCNAAVWFVIRFEQRPRLYFASLQSKAAEHFLQSKDTVKDISSFVIMDEDGNLHTKWKATLYMFHYMGGVWRYLGAVLGFVLPTALGNFFYSCGWKYRRVLMGESETCVKPTGALRLRLIPNGEG